MADAGDSERGLCHPAAKFITSTQERIIPEGALYSRFVYQDNCKRCGDCALARLLRRPRLQLDSVTLLHAGQDDVDVQVPHPGQHVVVRLRVLLEGESAILVQGLGYGVAQLILVRTAFGDDRHAVDGAGVLDLLELTGGTALDGQGVL